MNIYNEIREVILSMRVANKKIYKPILILSYLSYLEEHPNQDFNNLIEIELLIDYISIYMEDVKLREHLFKTKKVDITKLYNDNFFEYQTLLVRKFKEMPLSKIVNDNNETKFFQTNLGYEGPQSRKVKDLPSSFKIQIDSAYNKQELINTIKFACNEKIKRITSFELDIHLVSSIESNKFNNRSALPEAVYQSLDDTTRVSLTTSRKGQTLYRRKLLDKYNSTCALCDLNIPELLTASHAKPWSCCEDVHERLSENNGLLLCKNHDALFDKGLITIDFDKKLVIFSSKLDNNIIQKNIKGHYNKLNINISERSRKYISYHNEYVFKG